jgi:acetoin utilization deacetylase AcuC-like enzyme
VEGERPDLKVFYTDHFVLPLPEAHTFPIDKYPRLRQKVVESGLVRPQDLVIPHAATYQEIERAHDRAYLRRVREGKLTPFEIRRIGFPWSAQLVERSRRSCGATIEACRAALVDGLSVSLAGGTHHAFRDHGEGFCVFNDSVVASRAVQAEGRVRHVVIIDCDVHQGNGTAAILSDDPTIFTFSLHGKNNFPVRKERSDLDMPLDDDADDTAYLQALEQGLSDALEANRHELAIYIAGADPFSEDRYGRLALSKEGLAERDRLVLQACRAAGIPVAVTMGGGYPRRIEDAVDIHFQTVETAVKMAQEDGRAEQAGQEADCNERW